MVPSVRGLGDEVAMFNLATVYYHGNGLPKDLVQNERWLRASAAAGYEKAKQALRELESEGQLPSIPNLDPHGFFPRGGSYYPGMYAPGTWRHEELMKRANEPPRPFR